MNRKSYQNINLDCAFQSSNPFEAVQSETSDSATVLNGLFSRKADGTFSFEEVVPKVRDVRNAKLFDGSHISLVRRKDGKLQPHFKVISSLDNPQQLAYEIYSEIATALTQVSKL